MFFFKFSNPFRSVQDMYFTHAHRFYMNVVWNTIQSCYKHGQYKAKRGVEFYIYIYYEPKSNFHSTQAKIHPNLVSYGIFHINITWNHLYVINTWDTDDNNISCEIYINIFTWIFLLLYASREKFHGNFTCGNFAYDMNVLKVGVKIDIIQGLPC